MAVAHEYDDVYLHIKSFGRYQKVVFLGSYCMIIPMMLQFGLLVFAMGTPKFHCDVANSTCPPDTCCDNCTSYSFDGPFTSTVSEWQLICDRASLGATIQSCFFGGMLAACVVTGYLSDTFGRKITIFVCYAIMGCASVGSSFAQSFPVFAFLQFCVGFGQMGTTLSLYVFGIELVGPKRRTLAGNINGFYWECSGFITVLMAYLIRDWRILIVASAAPIFLLFLFVKVFPKSPRFLVSKGRLQEALKVMTKYGWKEGKPEGTSEDSEVLMAKLESIRKDQIIKEQNTPKHTPLDLLRTTNMRKWSLIMGYNWLATSMTDFALFLSLTSLAGNIYINATIMRILPLTLILPVWYLLKRFGRRVCHASFKLLAGATCLLALAVPQDQAIIKGIMAIAGYAFNDCTWTTVYLITSELFPTVIRNTALGAGSLCARIGAIVAPYMAMMGHLPGVGVEVPITIFGVLSIIAAMTTFWIPETLDAYMHQTIKEAEQADDYYGLPCFSKSKSVQLKTSDEKETTI